MSCFLGRVWEGFLAAWIHHKVKRERGAMLENTVAAHYCGLQLPPAWVNNLALSDLLSTQVNPGKFLVNPGKFLVNSW